MWESLSFVLLRFIDIILDGCFDHYFVALCHKHMWESLSFVLFRFIDNILVACVDHFSCGTIFE